MLAELLLGQQDIMKKLFLFLVLSMAMVSLFLMNKPFEFGGPSDFYYGIIFGITIGLQVSLIILYKIIKKAPNLE